MSENILDRFKESTWNDFYKLDIKLIDDQHKVFFEIYDDIIDRNELQSTDDELINFINKLFDYTKTHFKTEEALMERANYAGLEEQKRQHRFFIDRMSALKLAYNHKNVTLYSQLLVFIRKWFLSHILQLDSQYKNDVQSYLLSNTATQ